MDLVKDDGVPQEKLDGSVDYMFNTKESFDFYILNSVAHDFIHDFNNYGRMENDLKLMHAIKELRLGGGDIEVEATNQDTLDNNIV